MSLNMVNAQFFIAYIDNRLMLFSDKYLNSNRLLLRKIYHATDAFLPGCNTILPLNKNVKSAFHGAPVPDWGGIPGKSSLPVSVKAIDLGNIVVTGSA